MDTIALWIGYAVLVGAGTAATLAFLWWVVEFSIEKLGHKKQIIRWMNYEYRKKRAETDIPG